MATRFFTEEWRVWKIFSRSRFVCEMDIAEVATFGPIFSTTTTKLKDWYDKNPRAAKEFELRLKTTPMVFERSISALRHLRDAGEGYDFMKKIKVSVAFHNIENDLTETYDIVEL